MKRFFSALLFILINMCVCAQDYLSQAEAAYAAGDLNTAWQYAQKQCSENCNVATKSLMIRILFEAGEYNAAGMLAENVLKQLDKSNAEGRCRCYTYMGVAAFEQGNMKKANKHFASAIKEQPSNYWPYYERALTNRTIKKYEAALSDVQMAYERDTTDLNALLLAAYICEEMDRLDESDAWFQTAYRATEHKNGRVYAEQAASFYEQRGDSAAAVKLLYDGMAVDPTNPRAGRVYNQLLKRCPYTMLNEAYSRATELSFEPRWEAILGDIYDETLNLPDSGLVHYYKASRLSPSFDDGFQPVHRLVNRLVGLEEFTVSGLLTHDLMEADPFGLKGKTKEIYRLYEAHEYEAAIALILTLSPEQQDEAGLNTLCASLCYDLGRYEEAMQRYLEQVADNPDSRYLNYRLGRCYEQLGMTDAARASFNMVIAASDKYYNPKTKSVNITLGSGKLIPTELPLALFHLGEDNAPEVAKANLLELFMAQADITKKGGSMKDLNETMLYNTACMLAQVGLAGEALAALKMSVESGFTKPRHIELDPDLQAVRESLDEKVQTDYAQLVADLKQQNAEQIQRIYDILLSLDPERIEPLLKKE